MHNAADLERLWHTYRLKMANYIGRAVRDRELTEELVAIVYARAWVAMCNGNGYRDHEEPWLYQIARNVMVDEWRKRRHATMVDWDALEGREDEKSTPYELAESTLLGDEIKKALARLPRLQSAVMEYRWQGYQYAEIAEEINTNALAAKALGYRAQHRLRELLKEAI